MPKYLWGILLLALCARLYHVTFPVAGFQGWRQADTAAMAKNFSENGYDLLHPQIDWGGNTPGYVETEFPIYSYLVALLYGMFGFSEIWGRVLSIMFGLATIVILFLLVRRICGERVAGWSALIYAILPLNIFYSRAVMPESLMILGSASALYFFILWCDESKIYFLLLSAIALSIATLIKPPTLYLGLPLAFLSYLRYGRKALLEWRLWLYALMVVVPLILWYLHAHETFLATGLSFGIWDAGKGKWGNFELLLSVKFYNDIIFKSVAERHLTYAGFILLIIGLFIPRQSAKERVFDFWLMSIAIYFGIVAKGNQVHEYYQLPIALPAAIFIGKSLAYYLPVRLSQWKEPGASRLRALVAVCIVVLPVLSFIRYYHYMDGERLDAPIFRLSEAVQRSVPADALVVAVDEDDPLILYRSARKGWHASAGTITAGMLHELQGRGAKYVVGMKYFFDDEGRLQKLQELISSHEVIVDDAAYFIVKL